MKKVFYILSCSLLSLRFTAVAGEFADSGSAFSMDLPSGWTAVKSNDPAMVLKLEKGKDFFEFTRLDSELSEYYLKARVKEQADSLKSAGNIISGDIHRIGIRGGAAYYASYESTGAREYTAFFTHNGLSYAVSARGPGVKEFLGALSTIRAPGEITEEPKPKKTDVYRKPEREKAGEAVQVFKEDNAAAPAEASEVVSPEPVYAAAAAQDTEDSPGDRAVRAVWELMATIDDIGLSDSKAPYLRRQPLPFRAWVALLMLWLLGAMSAKVYSVKFKTPKLSPPLKEVPPDFFFPFIVSRDSGLNGCSYNVLTRQGQRLFGSFNSEHDPYLTGAVYSCLLFHVCWSFLAYAGWGGVVTGALLALPGGRIWASLPEIFFAVPLIAGLSIYFNQTRALRLFDSGSNLVMEVKKESAGCLIRDEKGKEIARVVKTGGLAARAWHFMDTDNMVVLTIREEYPAAHVLRRIFGNLGGALRSRYGIFAAERRAGFVFLDPSSADRFQIHLDFAFARMSHPAQILALVLYIVSTEKDPVYPWI